MIIDDYIIRKFQEAYLWVYDWTGIYAASVAAISVIVGNFLGTFWIGFNWIQILVMLSNLLILVPYYLDQDRQRYTFYNFRAMIAQRSLFRLAASCYLLSSAITALVMTFFLDGFGIFGISVGIYSLALWIYINLMVVCIREREPKQWFKRHVLATESSS